MCLGEVRVNVRLKIALGGYVFPSVFAATLVKKMVAIFTAILVYFGS